MRVISQDGRIDYPYEASMVFINAMESNVISIQSVGNTVVEELARYSTEEKAIKAMEMLHEEYEKYKEYRSYHFFVWFNHPKVFRFPKDDEVQEE